MCPTNNIISFNLSCCGPTAVQQINPCQLDLVWMRLRYLNLQFLSLYIYHPVTPDPRLGCFDWISWRSLVDGRRALKNTHTHTSASEILMQYFILRRPDKANKKKERKKGKCILCALNGSRMPPHWVHRYAKQRTGGVLRDSTTEGFEDTRVPSSHLTRPFALREQSRTV